MRKFPSAIRVLDNYELRPTSSGMDLQVYEYRVLGKGGNAGSMEWAPVESYHRDMRSALTWILRRIQRTGSSGDVGSLKEAIAALDEISKDIGRCARTYERAMKASEG